MTNQEIKQDFIDALFNRDVWTRRVNSTEYRTRCPFCGDSSKSEQTGHFYMHINIEDNSPIVYHCFLCEEGGVLQPSTLPLMDIDDTDLKSAIKTLTKTADKVDKKGIINDVKIVSFDYKCPPPKRNGKIKYIEDRLGVSLTDDNLIDMKVITSLKDFLIHNKIKNINCTPQIAMMLERDYVGFLSYGNSHILFRDVSGINDGRLRWIKYPITPKSAENRIIYTMQSTIDLFTEEEITINLAEGVMDILSAAYNLGQDKKNVLNIAVGGRYFDTIILFLVSIGLVGSNITVNIYADNDSQYNKKNRKSNEMTGIGWYKKVMNNYKYLFGNIYVYYNIASKDIGVPKKEISLTRYKI